MGALPFGPLGEELGWRGSALPRLQERYSALTSSLLIGVAWTAWHAPLFWAPAGTTISGRPVTVAAVGKYALMLVGLSILYTWICNNSRGSVGLAVAFHASWNAAFPLLLFPQRSDEATLFLEELSVIAVWVVALIIVARYGGSRLVRQRGTEPAARADV